MPDRSIYSGAHLSFFCFASDHNVVQRSFFEISSPLLPLQDALKKQHRGRNRCGGLRETRAEVKTRELANLITSDQVVTHGARAHHASLSLRLRAPALARHLVAESAGLCTQPLVSLRARRSIKGITALRSATCIIALVAQQVRSLRLDSHLESGKPAVGVRVLCATHPTQSDLI